MTNPDPPVTEDELHAHVDGLLGPDRQAAVRAHLRDHKADAERVAAYAAQRAGLRAAFAPLADRPVPPRLDPHILIEQIRWRRRMAWRAAAVALVAFGLGGGGGWALRGLFAPSPHDIATLVRDAVANHVIYAADRRRPTELGADQRDDLARWVSNRINHRVAPPDLSESGFNYIGGRLAATPEGPAGIFMYQNESGIRLTVFVRPDAKARDRPLSPVDAKPVGGAAWIDKGVGYSVVAPVPADELRRIAEQVRRTLG